MKGRMEAKLDTVAVGGTFDELHKGHKALLLKAFEVGKRVLIGLSSDEFARRIEKRHEIAPYKQRLEDLEAFLQEHDLLARAEILALNDPYGVTLRKGCIQGLVVSRETELVAKEINEKRKRMKLDPLQIIVIYMVPSENHTPICTTRIRRGEMDREGHIIK